MLKPPKRLLQLKVNGEAYETVITPNRTLLEVLRESLFLTGSKQGCDVGDCGSCTVLIDGKSIQSCIYLAIEAEGKNVTTIEGLANGPLLHPLQQAFVETGGAQCGYCTPGILMAAVALLNQNPHPTEQEIKIGVSGNLCRCTGYTKIFEAIKLAATRMAQK